jgi:hypothetical protein
MPIKCVVYSIVILGTTLGCFFLWWHLVLLLVMKKAPPWVIFFGHGHKNNEIFTWILNWRNKHYAVGFYIPIICSDKHLGLISILCILKKMKKTIGRRIRTKICKITFQLRFHSNLFKFGINIQKSQSLFCFFLKPFETKVRVWVIKSLVEHMGTIGICPLLLTPNIF